MQALLSKHRRLWTHGEYLVAVVYGLLFLALGAGCMVAARDYLLDTVIHPVSSPDLFLDMLPVMAMENFLVWGMPIFIAFTVFLGALYPERIPFSFKAIGLLFAIRSFSVILTPMGIRPDQVVTTAHGFFQGLAYGSNDFFFSGHVSFPFLMALIFWRETWIRYILLAATALFAATVLLAHTHYSIDVFAVPFIVPTIYHLSRRLFGTVDVRIPLMRRNLRQTALTHPSAV